MKNAPIRHRVEQAAYLTAKLWLRIHSHAGVRRFGRRLGRLAHRLAGGQRRLALANLELVLPGLGRAEHERIVRECFEHFGAYFCEFLSEGRFDRQASDALFEVEGWEHAEAVEEAGKGYFLMTGHYGAFELGAHPFTLRAGPVHMVARPADNPHIEADVARLRTRFGNKVIHKRGAARRMWSAVRKGGRVGIVIDQRVPSDIGIQVPFLGQPAWNSPVLAALSIRTGVPVVPIFTEPIEAGRYRLTVGAPIYPEGEGEDAERRLTERYLAEIESWIRKRPELWLWMHRKWEL